MTPLVQPSVAGIGDLEALATRYDIFLIDQFGVLHDGTAAYPGAVEALAQLKAAGKHVALLSNSGRRAMPNEERLHGLGFARETWDVLVTSGEVAWRILSGLEGEGGLKPGVRMLLLARDGDRSAIEGLDVEVVSTSDGADVVLIAGSEGDRLPLDHYRALLAPAARAGVPAICSNPDRTMLTPLGPCFGAGVIADLYEELGGPVRRIGKPFPEIYQAALIAIGEPNPARVVCIGDSIEHDVAGGHAVGVATALVRTGILAEAKDDELATLFRHHRAAPDWLLPRFVWREQFGRSARGRSVE